MKETEIKADGGVKGNILDKIVAKKRQEIENDRQVFSTAQLEQSELFLRQCYSLRDHILDPSLSGIIAEFKRQSPSKGVINVDVSIKDVTEAYVDAGASALSVLTDTAFFGGENQDLIEAREANEVPILRKDFMLDEYQIIEAKSIGADIVLLIASVLMPAEIKKLARLAKSLGMSVLLEVHNREELDRSICVDLDAIGVNNRNLGDFSVSLDHSYNLIEHIPTEFLKISESGLSDPETVRDLKDAGFDGFLIGENFMRQKKPGKAMQDFVKAIRSERN